MRRYVFGGVRTVFAVALAVSLGAFQSALGQEASLKGALLRNQVTVEAALYETTDGGRVFVLDRTREPPLLQFRGAYEILALSRVPAARGDEILRLDTGDDLVRVTALGAVTLYPRERPMGVPATRLGPADRFPALASASLDMQAALGALRARAGSAALDTPTDQAAGDMLLADAVRLTAEGLRASAEAPQGGERVAQLSQIRFVYGAGAGVRIEGEALVVQIDPSAGYAGRPSSLKVADAILNGG